MTALSEIKTLDLSNAAPADECEVRVEELEELVVHLSKVSAGATSAAIVVHEVAQPIAAAANYLGAAEQLLARDDPATHARVLEAVKLAQNCLVRSGEVMRNVRRSSEQKPFDPTTIDIGVVLTEVLEMHRAKGNLVPVIDISPGAQRAIGDPVQIAQVFSNLLRNAEDATEGQVSRLLHVSAALSGGDEIQVRIEDNGSGIAPDLRSELFRAISSTKVEGAGLGLSICKTIITQHKGRIWAEFLHHGTALCFTLPLCKLHPDKSPHPDKSLVVSDHKALDVSLTRPIGVRSDDCSE